MTATPDSPTDLATAFKQAMRHWASGVALLATRDAASQPLAMTVSSFTSVSDSPASVLVCVNRQTRIADCLAIGTEISLNILSPHHQELASLCANPAKQAERFTLGSWNLTGTPRLEDASTSMLCRVDKLDLYGTHWIVIAKLLDIHTPSQTALPLCYWQGGFRTLANS